MKALQQCVTSAWYRRPFWLTRLLMPLAFIYRQAMQWRRAWYLRHAETAITTFPMPVIIVGNLTVGGTGKTPFVIWLANFLSEQGYQPGIVSRGYGGKADFYPQEVFASSSPTQVGDEALLLARKTNCPVVVAPDRVAAVHFLLQHHKCNVVLSDDGLQHYRLGRAVEIAVVDGERRFGNEYCLPAGPLREPLSRLKAVDFVVANGEAQADEFAMKLVPGKIYNLQEPDITADPHQFAGETLHAIAGIGHPERFFRQLSALGISILPHRFPDHHLFQAQDIQWDIDTRVIMTEKDAVKCHAWIDYRYWCLPVTAQLPERFGEALLQKLAQWQKTLQK